MTSLSDDLTAPMRDVKQLVRRARQKIIRFLRLGFPIMAVTLLVVIFSVSDREAAFAPKPIEEVMPSHMGQNELLKPRFEAQDSKERPFSITADRALQDETNLNHITLQKPVADISLKDGSWVAIRSVSGFYKQDEQLLDLEGDVRLFHDAGYEIRTEKVIFDIDTQAATGDSPVFVQGPAGTLEAQGGLQADGNSATLTFQGPAKMVFRPEVLSPEASSERPDL